MRKIILLILSIFIFASNCVYASTNGTITTPKKQVQIDLSTIKINGDIVDFTICYVRNNNLMKSNVSVDVTNKTVAIIKTEMFTNTQPMKLLSSHDYSKKINYKAIKDGSSMDELYDIAKDIFASNSFFTNTNDTITTSKKQVQIDLSTIRINSDIVDFTICYVHNSNLIRSKISVNVANKTVAIIKTEMFTQTQPIKLLSLHDYSQNIEYKNIKNGSPMIELYDIAKALKAREDSLTNTTEWDRYFRTVSHNIKKTYKSNAIVWYSKSGSGEDFLIPNGTSIVKAIIRVNKDGKILDCNVKNVTYNSPQYSKFNNYFRYKVQNMFLNTPNIFPSLPKNFKGDSIILQISLEYSNDKHISSKKGQWNDDGIASITIGENSSFLANTGLCIVDLMNVPIIIAKLPLNLIYTIFIEPYQEIDYIKNIIDYENGIEIKH